MTNTLPCYNVLVRGNYNIKDEKGVATGTLHARQTKPPNSIRVKKNAVLSITAERNIWNILFDRGTGNVM